MKGASLNRIGFFELHTDENLVRFPNCDEASGLGNLTIMRVESDEELSRRLGELWWPSTSTLFIESGFPLSSETTSCESTASIHSPGYALIGMS